MFQPLRLVRMGASSSCLIIFVLLSAPAELKTASIKGQGGGCPAGTGEWRSRPELTLRMRVSLRGFIARLPARPGQHVCFVMFSAEVISFLPSEPDFAGALCGSVAGSLHPNTAHILVQVGCSAPRLPALLSASAPSSPHPMS